MSFEREVKGNILLDALPEDVFAQVAPCLEIVDLVEHNVLQRPNKPVAHAYFPVAGLCSVIAMSSAEIPTEVGIIGYEGFTGTEIALSVDTSPLQVLVQKTGRAARMERTDVKRLIADHREFHAVLMKFVHAFMIQNAQTTDANSHYRLSQRLARWLLMCQDRSLSSSLELTHDFLATMLSVRRPSVSEALEELEGKRWIENTRGKVRILQRRGLIEWAGSSYGVAEDEYAKLFRDIRT